jgi:hypothetical protein
MKIKEIINESKLMEGARIMHAEDLVFFEGSAGAIRAVNNLASLAKNKDTLSIKWDGCIHPDHLIQTNKGELRIEEIIDRINEGEEFSVLGHNFDSGNSILTKITNGVKKYGAKAWIEIELENGDKIQLTEDHQVFTTNRGWIAAGNLTSDDDIKEL